jgi:hypothetical protein
MPGASEGKLIINVKYHMIGNVDIQVKELCKLPMEVGWVEFKYIDCRPTMIGEDISILANSAILNGNELVWGVNDSNHEIVGNWMHLHLEKKG